jgi:beta-lactamase regulating signal transducer with metallopeptidase domain
VPLVVRSRILVPFDAEGWTEARRTIVLLHEMAHIGRRDFRTKLVVDLACSLHWFNPLAWIARRRSAVTREQACDDAVLAAGIDSRDYAGELIAFARRLAGVHGEAVAGLPMARPSTLEARLRAMFEPGRSRRRPAAVQRLALVLVATMLALALSSATPSGSPGVAGDAWTPAAADGGWAPAPPSPGWEPAAP